MRHRTAVLRGAAAKRFVSILLVWCLVLPVQLVALAGADEPVKIGVADSSGAPGDTVTVAVYLDPGTQDVSSYSIKVLYDSDILEQVQDDDVTDKSALGMGFEILDTSTVGAVEVWAFSLTAEREDVFSIDFRIKDGAPAGHSAITVETASYTSDGVTEQNILTENITSGTVDVTGRDITAPTVTDATYSDSLAVDANLQLTFSEEVAAAPGQNIVIHKTADDSVAAVIAANDSAQVTVTGATVTINPAADLDYDTEYYVLINEGALQDLAGNAYAGITDKTVWSFATAAAPLPDAAVIEIGSASGVAGETVQVPVKLISTTSAGIASYGMRIEYDPDALEATEIAGATGDFFASTIDESHGWLKVAWVDAAGGDHAVTAGSTLFTITFNIKEDASAGDKPLTVSNQDEPMHFTFTDAASEELQKTLTAGIVTVGLAPTVTDATYSDALAVDANLQLTFSEEVAAAAGQNIVIHKAADDSVAAVIAANDSAQVTVTGATVTINPAADLDYDTEYYVLIDAGAFEDTAGIAFAGIADKTVWSFTTAAAPIAGTATVEIGSVSEVAGETVNVPVKLVSTTSAGIASYGIVIEYDSTALEATEITGANGDYFAFTIDESHGWLKAAWVDATGGDHAITAGNTLFTIAFSIKEGAAEGDKPLTVSNQDELMHFTVTDVSAKELQKTLTAGKVTVELPPPSNNDDYSPPPAPSDPNPVDNGVDVLVNGKVENAGTAVTETVNDQQVTTVTVDPAKLEARLAEEGDRTVVTIPVNTKSDVVVGVLNGQMVKSMEQKQAVVEIKTDKATYTLPAQQININAISEQIGKTVALQDIQVQIEVAAPKDDVVKLVENSAAEGGFAIVAPPLEFTVRGVYEDKSIVVDRFKAYVERTIAIPAGADPSKITTGIVVDSDGTVRHVPTQIIMIDGKYYAKLNSLTNSTYSVVWHPIEFRDVEGHWAQDAVNNMGSRMVIDGIGNSLFNPDQYITRAEFAAIMVRGLGLKPESGIAPFADVSRSDWFNDAVQTAYSYALIDGFKDSTFRPADNITREQAMVIIAKAMAITGLKSKLPVKETGILTAYTDAGEVSVWAEAAVGDCLQTGIVTGRSDALLAPKAYMTRAEVAAIVQRLLQLSELI